ncbi:MAG: histidine phosphatase family protein [Rubripirellula sp.]
MQLYLIRHAESENNAKPGYLRTEDPSLTAIGRLQAQHLAAWAATQKFDALITSPVRRALQTTRFITDSVNCHVHVWADVFEQGGIYPGFGPDAIRGGDGLSRSQVIQHVTADPTACTLDESIHENGWWAGRDRETPEQMVTRATQVIERLVDTFADSNSVVLAVIHADFKYELLHQLMGWGAESESLGHLRNTSISHLIRQQNGWRLDCFNSVSHLPGRLARDASEH